MRRWSAQNLAAVPEPRRQEHLSSWYAQGLTDEIGDRLLMFDNAGGPSLELLRFRAQLVDGPRFESALRERVELLTQFRHPAFAQARAVEYLGQGNGLTLVSTYVHGKRLSEALPMLRGPVFAPWLVRELVPALASLQHQGRTIAHGCLTTDRIVMTPNRELVIVEHVLGTALEQLRLPSDELWARFGIASSDTEGPGRLDQRADVLQIGIIALAMLLGRNLRMSEFPGRLPELYEQVTGFSDVQLAPSFARWLGRALQIDAHPFESAHEADRALGELIIDGEHYQPPPVPELMAALGSPQPIDPPVRESRPERVPQHEREARPDIREVRPEVDVRIVPEQRSAVIHPVPESGNETSLLFPAQETNGQTADGNIQDPGISRRVVGALAAVLVAQAIAIGYLLLRPIQRPQLGTSITFETSQPGTEIMLNGRSIGRTPLSYQLGPDTKSIRLMTPTADPVAQTPADVAAAVERSMPTAESATAAPLRAAPVRSGGIRLVTPIEVQVVEGDRVLGSSADGAIVAGAGRREFEMVNSALGYRVRQVIDIKPGQITSVTLPRPNGQLNVNAIPWADVWIDGKRIGETPLANVSIPIGEHEIVFRHPTLGEQRRTTMVRFDVPARVSADLR